MECARGLEPAVRVLYSSCVGPAAVAPLLKGLRAQAPSPSFTEGTYAVSKLCDLTERSLEHDRDAGRAANRRRAAARCFRRNRRSLLPGTSGAMRRTHALVGGPRPLSAGRRRLQSRTRNEPDDGRAIARRRFRRARAGGRLCSLAGGRVAGRRQARARSYRADIGPACGSRGGGRKSTALPAPG